MEPILSALWTLMPAMGELRVLDFGPGRRKDGRTMKSALHRNMLTPSFVIYCPVSHPGTISASSSKTADCPIGDRQMVHASAPSKSRQPRITEHEVKLMGFAKLMEGRVVRRTSWATINASGQFWICRFFTMRSRRFSWLTNIGNPDLAKVCLSANLSTTSLPFAILGGCNVGKESSLP